MAVSVTILGLALLTVFLAYIAFGDANERSDPSTVRYVAIVSLTSSHKTQVASKCELYIDRFNDTVTAHRRMFIPLIRTKTINGAAASVHFH